MSPVQAFIRSYIKVLAAVLFFCSSFFFSLIPSFFRQCFSQVRAFIRSQEPGGVGQGEVLDPLFSFLTLGGVTEKLGGVTEKFRRGDEVVKVSTYT